MIQSLAERKNKKKLSKSNLCQLLKIPRSSYYAGIKPKIINANEVHLDTQVKQVFNQSHGSAGARTISHIVSKEKGIKLTRYKAGKIMKRLGLVSRQYRHCSEEGIS